MHKCIDASPLIIYTQEEEYVVLIGSHANLFAAINCSDGNVIWTTSVEDRIESSATLSADLQSV